MEENIKRVEHLIERCNQCKSNACITCDICWSEVQAIENLLKGYKELEEENKTLTDEYMIQKHLINADFLKDYIPISVIQNKLDKLEHEKFKRTQLGVFLLNNFENQRLLAQIEVLQELLQESEK